MSATIQNDPEASEIHDCEDFLRKYYKEEVYQLAGEYPKDRRSLWIEYADLQQFDTSIADDLLTRPTRKLRCLEEALANLENPVDQDLTGATVRVTDSKEALRRHSVTDLLSNEIGKYVAVRGQLSRVTDTNHRTDEVAFECQRCGTLSYVPQTRSKVQEPHECRGCDRQGPFKPNFDESTIVDQRKLKLEEPPEDRTQGDGVSVPVYVESDLCHHGGENGLADRVGEQVVVLGQYRANEGDLQGSNASPEFDGWLDAHAIEFVESDLSDIDVQAHKDQIREFASNPFAEVVALIKLSIAPTLDRTEDLDKFIEAAVAWLFNGYRIDPDDGEQIRGDLHLGVFGDPGTGKSTTMADLHNIAPKSEYRSGTGLTKVGLTAAAKQEEFAGKSEWTLVPGVLPRANGGHCLIDEADGVVDDQTKAIHDALEGDQMVKAEKAGISADLPTRTAVLLGGNPEHGRFGQYEPLPQQVDLDPALVSRMDVLLSMTDEVDEERDRSLATHVLEGHDELSRAEVAQRTGEVEEPEREATNRPVPVEVLRAWIHYARETCFPLLTEDAKDVLREFYIEVRDENDGHSKGNEDAPVPVTPRKLPAGIRLATAFARVELSDTIEQRHAERAVRVSRWSLGVSSDEEGRMDADVIETGTSKAQRDRIKNMTALIEELMHEHDEGAPKEEILDRAGEIGMDGSKAEHEIEQLKQKGVLFEPAQGVYRLT